MDYNGEGTDGGGETTGGKPAAASTPNSPAVPVEAINGLKEQFAKFTEQQKIENAKPVKQKLAEAANNSLKKNNIKGDNTSQVKDKLVDSVKSKQVVPAPKQATLSAEDPYKNLNSFERGMIVNNPVTKAAAVAGAVVTTSVVAVPVAVAALPLFEGTPIERISSAGADIASQCEMLTMQDSSIIRNFNFMGPLAAVAFPKQPYFSSALQNAFPISYNGGFKSTILGEQKLSDAASKTIIGGTANLFGDELKLGKSYFGEFSSNFFGNQAENIFNLLKDEKVNQDSIYKNEKK
jgi:hypothetical protein